MKKTRVTVINISVSPAHDYFNPPLVDRDYYIEAEIEFRRNSEGDIKVKSVYMLAAYFPEDMATDISGTLNKSLHGHLCSIVHAEVEENPFDYIGEVHFKNQDDG